MKRIYNFISIAVLALAAVGCIEDINTDMPSAVRGDEVQFGLSLDGPKTKTVYGMEANNAFPVYWVNGDKVAVYSPECLTGRNSAEYQVSVAQAQNYADQLTKTGEVGVQWGSSDNATFYSIYPSANATISGSGDNVIAALNIPSTQMLTHTLVDGTYYASDMNSVIMYAKKSASKSDGAVNLQYTPYSTVIEFELTGDFSSNAEASLFIESLTLTAASSTEGDTAPNLAGNFNFKFSETPEISAIGNNRNNITLQFSTQPELTNTKSTLKAKMCLMPIGVESLNGWTVSVTFRDGENTQKTLVKTLNSDGKSTALIAGMVHKIKLPKLVANKKWVYTPGSWMPQLPEYEKIYVTELSIPGAWYAGSKTSQGYQATNDFSVLWRAGVRAFGVQCRCYTPRTGFFGGGDLTNASPTRVCYSGNGSEQNGAYTHQWAQESAMIYIDQIIKEIAGQVANTNEFAVLILDYATGSSGGYRELDYKYFLQGLQTEISLSEATNITSAITPSTTIEDVKGQLIIKVNVDSRVSYACSDVNAMFSTVPLIGELDLKSIYYSDLKYGSWIAGSNSYTSSPTLKDDSFLWCFTSANRTQTDTNGANGLPTYKDRKNMLEAMMSHSREISQKSDHNIWFYFNCGGIQVSSNSDTDGSGISFATEMNPWLKKIIDRKLNGYEENGINYPSDASPLGIVMFNQCTGSTTNTAGETTKGEDIIRAIIEMNNKFKLKRKGGLEDTLVGIDSWDSVIL